MTSHSCVKINVVLDVFVYDVKTSKHLRESTKSMLFLTKLRKGEKLYTFFPIYQDLSNEP